jgi:hypothetical protein
MIQYRNTKWAVRVACMREMNACSFGRSKRKKSLGRPLCRWEGNIKMDIREIRLEDEDRVHLTRDRDQWRCILNVMSRGVP